MVLGRYWHISEYDLVQILEDNNYNNKQQVKVPKLLRIYAFGKNIRDEDLTLPYYVLQKPTYEQIMGADSITKEFLIYLNDAFRIYFSSDDKIYVEI